MRRYSNDHPAHTSRSMCSIRLGWFVLSFVVCLATRQFLTFSASSADAATDDSERDKGNVVTLGSGDDAEKLKESADVVVIAYYKDAASNESLTFSDIADQYDDYKFGLVQSEEVATKLGFTKGEGVRLFKKFDEGEVDYDKDLKSASELKRFIQANSLPLVVTFDQKNAQKIFGGDIKTHILLFFNQSDAKSGSILEEFKKSAQEFKGRVLFVVVNIDRIECEHERITELSGLKRDELSGLRFIRLQDDLKKYKYPHEEIVANKLNEFVLSALNGTLQPFMDVVKCNSYINQFNRNMLLPLIKSLVEMDYFRYVKVNLDRPCSLWCNADKCNLRDCHVKTLSDPNKCPLSTYEDDNELATVNTELASDQLGLLIKLFECNDNDEHDSKYVDLLLNPERFTGYSGESAHRIWRAIYEENCFVSRTHNPFQQELCYEERLFYEAISGLQTSINIHLCAEYPSNAMIGLFEPNLNEFLRRFEGHADYIENLYKLFLIELRALAISKQYLLKRVNWPNESTKSAIQDLFTVVDKFKMPTFKDFALKPSHVSHELAIHFRNITTTIIDCVACDKCKLWGKVQLRGLGTALKVLSIKDVAKLHLNQQEIVSLVNAIARLSHSIRNLEQFRDLLVNSNSKDGVPLLSNNVIQNNPLDHRGGQHANPFK